MRRSGQIVDNDAKINWSVLNQLFPYLKEFRARIIIALTFMVAAKLSTIALPFILKMIVDGLNQQPINLENSIFSSLPIWTLTPLALVFAYGFFRFSAVIFGELRDTIFGRVTERAIRSISLIVFVHLHALDVDFHLNR